MIKKRYRNIESLKVMGSAANKALGPTVDVLVWNVFKCQKRGWQNDFIDLVHNKDLVMLQEAVVNSSFDNFFTTTRAREWLMARSFGHVKNNIETGVKTGSNVAANDYQFSASLHGEPFTATRKMCMASWYPLHNNTEHLLVVNTHLINFVSFAKFRAHLNLVFQTLRQHEGPVLLAGDFNTWNAKRMKYLNTLASAFALQQVAITRQPRIKHLLRHLDHVYCRDLDIVDAQVHTHINSSDHFPISLRFNTQ